MRGRGHGVPQGMPALTRRKPQGFRPQRGIARRLYASLPPDSGLHTAARGARPCRGGRAFGAPFFCAPAWSRKVGTGFRTRSAQPKRDMPKRTDISTILIIGAGPIVIGQACEFDYSGTQACKALKDEGYRIVLVNSNPATIMTDPDLADATYIEPITPEIVAKIIEKERNVLPGGFALLPTMGGQTALNCALSLRQMGTLEQIRRRDDRRDRRRDRQGRGPRAVPRRDDQDRARDAALQARQCLGPQAPGSRALQARARVHRRTRPQRCAEEAGARRLRAELEEAGAGAARALSGSGADRGVAGARLRRPAGDHPARPSRSAAPAAASPTTRRSSSRSSSAGSTPRRPTRC